MSRSGSGRGGEKISPTPAAVERFRNLDRYRVDREWKRYEGTPQRDLFRQLRDRFLERHARVPGRVLEIGPGPGRFTLLVGDDRSERVVLDVSLEALRYLRENWGGRTSFPLPRLVRGDATRPPLRPGSFDLVAALGNPLGFAGANAVAFLSAALELVRENGTIVLETVVGPGERSRYLRRLPPSAVGRLLRAPVAALAPRIAREGFERAHGRVGARHGFRRFSEAEVQGIFRAHGVVWRDAMAIAPLLGSEPLRIEEVARSPIGWQHLLELEEQFGRQTEHRNLAASALVAGLRVPSARPSNARD